MLSNLQDLLRFQGCLKLIAPLTWIAVLLAAVSGKAEEPWRSVIECRKPTVELERFNAQGRISFFRLVISDSQLIQEIRSVAAVLYYRHSEDGQIILPLTFEEINDKGEWQFFGDGDAERFNGRYYEINFEQARLKLKTYRTSPRRPGSDQSAKFEIQEKLFSKNLSTCQRS